MIELSYELMKMSINETKSNVEISASVWDIDIFKVETIHWYDSMDCGFKKKYQDRLKYRCNMASFVRERPK